MKKIVSALTSLLLLAVMSSCSHEEKKPNIDTAKFILSDTMQKIIKLDEVTTDKVDGIVSLNGEVTYDQNNVIKVMPIISGICQDVSVNLGDRVSQGQTLAVVKSSEAVALQNELVSARSAEALAKKNLEVTQSMTEKGVASQRDILQAQQELAKAESDLNRVTNQLSIIGTSATSKGANVTLTSPESGFIVERKLNPNQLIRPDDGTPLFTVSDLKKVWVMANVYEVDVEKVKVGDSVIVKTLAHPDKIFHGKMSISYPMHSTLWPGRFRCVSYSTIRSICSNRRCMLVWLSHSKRKTNRCLTCRAKPSYLTVAETTSSSTMQKMIWRYVRSKSSTLRVPALTSPPVSDREKVISKSALLVYQAIRQ
jgi:multidrug efflux pump subunit AcrA (membrane-fusion protein)